jgi:GxxExxY protein
MALDRSADTERVGSRILAAAMRVHSATGPGLLESAYEYCLDHSLRSSGMKVERQLALPIYFEEERIEGGYRIDLLVEGAVVIEVKAVEKLMAIHVAQMATYLRLGKFQLGFLLNFNVRHMRQGIKRVVL